jgi:hypothetical protein
MLHFVLPATALTLFWWVVLGAAVDAGVGILTSLVKSTFDARKVAGWLITNIVSVALPVFAVGLLFGAGMVPAYVYYGAAATALATFLGGISSKLGVPLRLSPNVIPDQPPAAPGGSSATGSG